MKKFLFALILFPLLVSAQDSPKLVVGIVVDQMRTDYIYRYWDKFEDDGFKRLINEGYFCRNTHFNYIPTYTGPGHASIYTGTTPSVHGIIANNWYERATGESRYCVQDKEVMSLGTANENGMMSPKSLLTPTLGDAIRVSNLYKGKSIGISIKDRGAILPAGHSANAAYWLDYESGKMISSTYYFDNLPKWVSSFNSKNHAQELTKLNWTLSLAPELYTESTADLTDYEKSIDPNTDPVFPYDLKPVIEAKEYYGFATTPHGNTLLRMFAEQCITEEDLGQDEHLDMIAISFSSPDMIGHMYGPQSMEVEDTYIKLDQEIAQLLEALDLRVGKGNYLLFLTADHAAAHVPSYTASHGMPANYFDKEGFNETLIEALNKNFPETELFANYSNQQIFLDRAAMMEHKIDFKKVSEVVRNAVLDFPGVANLQDVKQLQHPLPQSHFSSLAINGWNPQRSGDIVIQLLPGWMQYGPKGTTHGTSYSYDTHVPLIFFGSGVDHGESIAPVNITQIAPTVSLLSRIAFPDASSHEPIDFD
ncbi:MAG: alkaline phosphatase family protein [Flavobacteriales bacterium]|nr:alkaline phosphatase family protein [Flavobacteriales bacterium]